MKVQQEKDQIEISLNNKVEILQYKLLSGNDGSNVRNSQAQSQADSAENTFKELLKLCRGDLKEILNKMYSITQNDDIED